MYNHFKLPDPAAALSDLQGLARCAKPRELCPCSWGLAAALAAPHFLYAFIWFRPGAWQRVFGRRSVDVFAACGAIGKALQFAYVLLWVACSLPRGLCLDTRRIGVAQWLLALALAGYGQSLNAGIFAAIGKVGVYYGFKLGHRVPWVTGWPFDTVSHPQYVGSVLTVWALVAMLWGQLPHASLLVLGAYWTGLYVVTGWHEEISV